MYIKKFEAVSNLSKIRKWSDADSENKYYSDLYFTYDLSKKELGKYLNTWFVGRVVKSPHDDRTIRDEMITLKKVDKDTIMYGEKINPITLNIMCPTGARFKQDENGNDLYEMKAQIHSIDDSSYGIWWYGHSSTSLPLNELKSIREKIMLWINRQDEVNGEEFLNYCVSLGADAESKDYN